jgi:protein TonB
MHGATLREAIHALAAPAVIAAALIVGACSKGEPESKQVKPNAPIEISGRKAAQAVTDAPVDDALKERLARQEAASRLFERNVLQPTPPRSAEPKPAAAAIAPAAAPAATNEATRPPSPIPESEKTAPAPMHPATEPKPALATAPPMAASKPASPRMDLAAAKPTSAPEPAVPRLLSRVEPDFPTEALRAGIDRGVVRARLSIDGGGSVTHVEILDANPRRVFDRSVTRALGQWKFNEGSAGRTVDSEVAFRK